MYKLRSSLFVVTIAVSDCVAAPVQDLGAGSGFSRLKVGDQPAIADQAGNVAFSETRVVRQAFIADTYPGSFGKESRFQVRGSCDKQLGRQIIKITGKVKAGGAAQADVTGNVWLNNLVNMPVGLSTLLTTATAFARGATVQNGLQQENAIPRGSLA